MSETVGFDRNLIPTTGSSYVYSLQIRDSFEVGQNCGLASLSKHRSDWSFRYYPHHVHRSFLDYSSDSSGAIARLSNASQSPVPVGIRPIERHFQRPTASVNRLHAMYAIFWRGRTLSDLTLAGVGANGANAAFIPAIFLKGDRRSMNTIPMLKI